MRTPEPLAEIGGVYRYDPTIHQSPMTVQPGDLVLAYTPGREGCDRYDITQIKAGVLPVPKHVSRHMDIEVDALREAAEAVNTYTDMTRKPKANGALNDFDGVAERVDLNEFEMAGERMLASAKTDYERAIELLVVMLPRIHRHQQLADHHHAQITEELGCLTPKARELLGDFQRVGDCIYRLTAQDKLVCVHVPDLKEDLYDLQKMEF